MDKSIRCDLAIIGAGSGGLSLAAGASQLGLKVILVEERLMGGDCLNFGCIPSKSLLAAAKANWQTQHNTEFGVTATSHQVNFNKVMNHVEHVKETIAVNDSVERFESLGVQVIQATGSFIDESTLSAGTTQIKAKYFVIATGSSAATPPVPGLDKVPFYTNETIFNLAELPKQLLVIGGGPIGCELAQAYAKLGSQVTLVEGLTLLRQDDPEAVDQIRQTLINSGVTIYEHCKILQVTQDPIGTLKIESEYENKKITIQGTDLLVAAGRIPNIDALNCSKAGIQTNNKGIIVDQRLRSTNKKIYAIGDVAGALQFTHVANYHAGIVLRNIAFKFPAKANETTIPWVTYTDPELAQVGKTAAACDSLDIKYKVFKIDYENNDRAQTEQQTSGFIKLITSPKGKILGVTIVGHSAGELLLPWIMAIREGKSLRAFTDAIIPYPTLSELSKRVASQFYTPKLFSTGVKKLVRFLSFF